MTSENSILAQEALPTSSFSGSAYLEEAATTVDIIWSKASSWGIIVWLAITWRSDALASESWCLSKFRVSTKGDKAEWITPASSSYAFWPMPLDALNASWIFSSTFDGMSEEIIVCDYWNALAIGTWAAVFTLGL